MRSWALAALPAAVCADVPAQEFTTADVLARSAHSTDCLDWKVVGVCLWLHCKYGRCRVRTTPRVRHYLPDLVFTAYGRAGDSPWRETRMFAAASPLGGGSHPGVDVREGHALRFKEVDAIGHPLPLVRKRFDVPYLCRSQAKPLFPYFISALDLPGWRAAPLEAARPESVTPGLREVGDWPAHSWGAVFPRTGFVQQPEDAKAAAVAAQRACDIVTRPGQARVYVPFGYAGHRRVEHGDPAARGAGACEDSGGRWSPPGPGAAGRCRKQAQLAWLPPINERNARWQMLSPRPERGCGRFGARADWPAGRTSADGRYAWNLWRRYECCVPGKGRYLGHQSL